MRLSFPSCQRRERFSPVAARWRSFKAIVRLWVELFARDNLLTYASAIALQTLVAAISCALLGLGILGAAHDTSLWSRTIGPAIEPRVLHEVFRGANAVVQEVFSSSSAGVIAFAACLAVWEVSGVVRAVIGALNSIYETEEERPWWIRFPLSLGVSVVFMVALLGAILLLIAVHAPGAWEWPVAIVRWAAAIGLIVVAFGALVRLAPAEHRATRWASAGAALVVGCWVVESLIFRWYVSSVADFKTAIGSVVVFLVLTSYLYVGAIILLVGMELDEIVRLDAGRPRSRQQLLPLVERVIAR
jgi:membrane protein